MPFLVLFGHGKTPKRSTDPQQVFQAKHKCLGEAYARFKEEWSTKKLAGNWICSGVACIYDKKR